MAKINAQSVPSDVTAEHAEGTTYQPEPKQNERDGSTTDTVVQTGRPDGKTETLNGAREERAEVKPSIGKTTSVRK